MSPMGKFDDREIMYTVLAEERPGLVEALQTLEPVAYEVIVHPERDHEGLTLRSESIEGTISAVSDLGDEWDHCIIRVFGEAGTA